MKPSISLPLTLSIGALLLAIGLNQPRAAAQTTATPTIVGSATSPLLALTPVIGTTPLPTLPAMERGSSPGVSLVLPRGWRYGYFSRVSTDLLIQGQINLGIYTGPIRTGNGTIILLWNYPSISPMPTAMAPGAVIETPTPGGLDPVQQALWADGLRLLQGTVVDITCNIGHYGQRRDLTVGKLPAIGESFTASQCADEPDAVGWFAGIRQFDVDYLFFVYIEPAEQFNDLKTDIQIILDTAVFSPLARPTLAVSLTPNGTPNGTPSAVITVPVTVTPTP